MKFQTVSVSGLIGAIRGMRLPLCKDYEEVMKVSDSYFDKYYDFIIGKEDLILAQKLIRHDMSSKIGQPNSKFLRMIHVQVCITAPLAFWKEYDTYKVATVANSTSTMHTLHRLEITEDMFEKNPLTNEISCLVDIPKLEEIRKQYNKDKDKSIWYDLIYGLGESWLQTRMCDLNYETIRSIVSWRDKHKQNCWSGKDNEAMPSFIKWAKELPYAKELLFYKGENNE